MGYVPCANSYYDGATAAVAAAYDYGQPIHTAAAAAESGVTDPALAIFDAGCASFKQGNSNNTLQQTDSALVTLPNNTTLHDFRALCLSAAGHELLEIIR
jgi:hypothetical protein